MKFLNNFGISVYRYIVISVFFICSSALFAQDAFDAANAAYADGRYEEAAAMYQSLLDEQPDATLYYNLGNARSNSFGSIGFRSAFSDLDSDN